MEGVAVPLPKPVFFRFDRLTGWRSTLFGAWLRVRARFHRNPGFATAAVAGSAGLILTVVMLAGHGWGRLPGGSIESPDAEATPVLGASTDTPEGIEAAGAPENWSRGVSVGATSA